MVGDIISAMDRIERLTNMSINTFIENLLKKDIVIISSDEYNKLKKK